MHANFNSCLIDYFYNLPSYKSPIIIYHVNIHNVHVCLYVIIVALNLRFNLIFLIISPLNSKSKNV